MKIAGAAVAGLVLFASSQASAADSCSQTTIVASVAMASDSDALPVIPATLGTIGKPMVVNTGAEISEIGQPAVDEMHLPTFINHFGMYKPQGNHGEKAVGISPVGIGSVSTKNYVFRVARTAHGDTAGMIGADMLRAYDLDFDFGGGKFNLVSPAHCYGRVISWQANAVAAIDVTVTLDGRIVLPLTIDGHAVKALLDTGAATSSIDQDVAHSLLNAPAGPEQTFQSLGLDPLSITNPKLSLVKVLKDSAGKPVDSTTGAQMVLGMNVLKHLHLYVAYGEKRLYITPK